MNKKEQLTAVIIGAVSAYIQQEESVTMLPEVKPHPKISSWQLFGRQELMKTRTLWRTRRQSLK